MAGAVGETWRLVNKGVRGAIGDSFPRRREAERGDAAPGMGRTEGQASGMGRAGGEEPTPHHLGRWRAERWLRDEETEHAGGKITLQVGGISDSNYARNRWSARWTSCTSSRSSSGRPPVSDRQCQGVMQVLRRSRSGRSIPASRSNTADSVGSGLAGSRGVSSRRPWVPPWRSPESHQLSTYSGSVRACLGKELV
jgi:hypothetical protein